MTDTKTQITDILIQDCIVRAVQSVFRTMMGQEARFVAQVAAEPSTIPLTASQIIGSVGFIGGANGLIYLCLSEEFAKIASGKILGMTQAEIESHGNEVIHDAIGEITNMTVGSFKNGLCDVGYPCKLTIPSILRGTNFSIEPISSATRYVYYFEYEKHRLVADILLKNDES